MGLEKETSQTLQGKFGEWMALREERGDPYIADRRFELEDPYEVGIEYWMDVLAALELEPLFRETLAEGFEQDELEEGEPFPPVDLEIFCSEAICEDFLIRQGRLVRDLMEMDLPVRINEIDFMRAAPWEDEVAYVLSISAKGAISIERHEIDKLPMPTAEIVVLSDGDVLERYISPRLQTAWKALEEADE